MTEICKAATSDGRRLRRTGKFVVTALIASISLAGCGGGDNGNDASSGKGKNVSVVMLGGPSSDPFFSTIKAGAEAAAASYGSKLKLDYLSLANYENMGPDMAKLEASASSQKPDVVVTPDWIPDAQNEGLKKLVENGTPVVLYNAGGAANADEIGAVSFIGTDDTNIGVIAAKAFLDEGSKNVVCVNTTPGSQNNEDRCAGLVKTATAAGAKASKLQLPASSFGSPTAVSQAIKAQLLKDPSIDGIFCIGAGDSDSAASGIESAGKTGKVKLGNAGVGDNALARIKGGDQAFLVDIQPYLQAYLAVAQAYQYAAYGLQYSNPTTTGPLTITSDNVQGAIEASKMGLR
jgi:simple sugar transport system substrate-binding protein